PMASRPWRPLPSSDICYSSRRPSLGREQSNVASIQQKLAITPVGCSKSATKQSAISNCPLEAPYTVCLRRGANTGSQHSVPVGDRHAPWECGTRKDREN